MTFVVLEDDYLQEAPLRNNLVAQFGAPHVTRLITAKEFSDALPGFGPGNPDIFLIDLLIPWHTVDQAAGPPPKEFRTPHRGIACQRLLQQNDATRNTPVILFTELDRTNDALAKELVGLPRYVRYLRKDAGYVVLNRLIRELLREFSVPDKT
jgi:CheY-like chemotaxis protein